MKAEPDNVDRALQPMKDRYLFLAENVSDVVFTLDLNLHFTYCSPSVERLRGFTAEETVSQTLEQVLTPASWRLARTAIKKGLAGERARPTEPFPPQTLELEVVRKGGDTALVEMKVSIVRNEKGDAVGILGISRDIAARKNTEEALRESEDRFRLLFEKSTDPILPLDGGRYSDCNEAALRLMGCAKERLVGLHPWDISPERQPDGRLSRLKVREIIATALREGSGRFEWLHQTFDGQELWADVTLTVLRVRGRPMIYTVWRDIEKRKKVEEALLTSQFHLSEVMDLAKIVYWELDPATETFSFNDSFYAFYGTTAEREGSLRMSAEEYEKRFIYPDDVPLVRQSAQNIRSGEERDSCVDLEHRIVRRSGEVRHILARTRVFRDEQGRIRRCYGANQDITERKVAEGEKAALVSQLLQAQKMEAIGTLAGGIAHDFNNILAAMMGFAEMAKGRTVKGSRQEQHLQRVLDAGARGRELVRQMLTFSRKTEQEKKLLRLSTVVREAIKLLRASIPSTIRIRAKVGAESGFVLADPTQMQQVLMNLCANAAYAMRETGGVLAIEVSDFVVSADGRADGMRPGPYVKLVVRDTGAGMPPEIMERIFDPFFTTKKPGEGTGLGLSIVHGIVEQHDGHITVESDAGKGSTFTLYLAQAESGMQATEPDEESVPTGRERVLFVDDEEALTQLGREMLEELGYEVTVRSDGLEALALFKADPGGLDLVMTDQTMPGMTGMELARELIRLRPAIPVIITTGYSDLVDAAIANEAGVRAFLMKPISKGELARTVRKALNRQDAGPTQKESLTSP